MCSFVHETNLRRNVAEFIAILQMHEIDGLALQLITDTDIHNLPILTCQKLQLKKLKDTLVRRQHQYVQISRHYRRFPPLV